MGNQAYESRRDRNFARRRLINGRLVSPRGIHGTDGCYSNHGCRCESCSQAHAQGVADAKAARVAKTAANGGIAPTGTHGASTYANWRCRCQVCVDAWNTSGYWMSADMRRKLVEQRAS